MGPREARPPTPLNFESGDTLKIRTRDKWRDRRKPRSVEDNGVALAYTAWQIALTAAKNLHAEDFTYESDCQRVGVVREYLLFLVHAADRRAYRVMDAEARRRFVTTMAQETARHYQRNVEEILGSGDYRAPFLRSLNDRNSAYAETRFSERGPGFAACRGLGDKIQALMGRSQTNRWVAQQVIDIDAPHAARELYKAMDNLLDTSRVEMRTGDRSLSGTD